MERVGTIRDVSMILDVCMAQRHKEHREAYYGKSDRNIRVALIATESRLYVMESQDVTYIKLLYRVTITGLHTRRSHLVNIPKPWLGLHLLIGANSCKLQPGRTLGTVLSSDLCTQICALENTSPLPLRSWVAPVVRRDA